MEVPILLNLQNAQIDSFIDESLSSLVFKELEYSKFLIGQFEESFIKSECNESNSDMFYSNNNTCFNNLIQFELESHDPTLNKVLNGFNIYNYLYHIFCNIFK